MEFKGTKGEWYVYDNDRFPEIKLKDQYVGQICMLPYTDAEFKKAVNSREENLANAKLIAAAPDLLQELQRLKLDMDLGTIPIRKDSPIYRGINEAIEKALK